jgi:hypothetical protein
MARKRDWAHFGRASQQWLSSCDTTVAFFAASMLAQLRKHQESFRAKGAVLVAIGLGDRMYAREFSTETGIKFPLLIDEKREAYRMAELRSANLLHFQKKDYFSRQKRALAADPHPVKLLAKNHFSWAGVLCLVRAMWTALRTTAKRLETTRRPRCS